MSTIRVEVFMQCHLRSCIFFFFNDTATTEIYTLSLHDALPIYPAPRLPPGPGRRRHLDHPVLPVAAGDPDGDRKSTRLNSSHSQISYAVFCLKKKTRKTPLLPAPDLTSSFPTRIYTHPRTSLSL